MSTKWFADIYLISKNPQPTKHSHTFYNLNSQKKNQTVTSKVTYCLVFSLEFRFFFPKVTSSHHRSLTPVWPLFCQGWLWMLECSRRDVATAMLQVERSASRSLLGRLAVRWTFNFGWPLKIGFLGRKKKRLEKMLQKISWKMLLKQKHLE